MYTTLTLTTLTLIIVVLKLCLGQGISSCRVTRQHWGVWDPSYRSVREGTPTQLVHLMLVIAAASTRGTRPHLHRVHRRCISGSQTIWQSRHPIGGDQGCVSWSQGHALYTSRVVLYITSYKGVSGSYSIIYVPNLDQGLTRLSEHTNSESHSNIGHELGHTRSSIRSVNQQIMNLGALVVIPDHLISRSWTWVDLWF